MRKTDAEVLEREKDENKKKLGMVARHYDRLFYKLDGYGYLPHERIHLWTVAVETGEVKQITDGPVFDEQNPNWSPDGKTIAFVSNRTQDPDAYPDRIDLFVMPAIGGEAHKIETPVGPKSYPSFSPDGQWIAYFAQEGEGLSYKNTNLWIVPADASGPACNLTGRYDLEVAGWTINDLGDPETIPPTWSPDSQTLFFQAAYHGSAILELVSVQGDNLQTVVAEGGVVSSFSFDREQAHLSYLYGTLVDPAQILVRDNPSGKRARSPGSIRRCWNRSTWAASKRSGLRDRWRHSRLDPQAAQLHPNTRYPSIMEIHGGPLTQYGNFFMHEFYYLASAGYVVYFSNPRGGRGYGEAHAGAIYGDWGSKDYADLMAWADYAANLPYIDPARMGVTGGSYGGYMTVWIIGHTTRFKAAVTQRCVSNFVSMWGSSDFNWVFQTELNDKAPFEDLKFYWDHSPIAYIGAAKTLPWSSTTRMTTAAPSSRANRFLWRSNAWAWIPSSCASQMNSTASPAQAAPTGVSRG